jgi:hypothetical protein
MKKFLMVLMLQLILSSITYAQQKKITNNYTQYFKEYSNNFKWNNFSFKTEFKNYFNDLNSLSDDDIILYQKLFNNTINDSAIIFKFNVPPIIQNIEFDDVFLNFGENSDGNHYQNLQFIKYFTTSSNEDKKAFYSTSLDILTKKFGRTSILNLNNIWGANLDLFFDLSYGDNYVSLTVISLQNPAYIGSVKQKFDYFFTSDKFKQIDKDNSFRGIKFGSNLESIKLITRLNKTQSNYEFIAKDSKYLNWNSITFSLDGTLFGFSKDKKLSMVMLRCDTNDEEEFYKLKEKIIAILGPETIKGEFIIWSGNNLTIFMSKDYNDSRDKIIVIKSNSYNTFFEKDY